MAELLTTHKDTVEKFEKYLDDHGFRKTPERFAILQYGLGFEGHFTIDELFEIMEAEGFHVSRATIYNTVQLLIDANIMRRIVFENHQPEYEPVGTPHTHLVCINCGKVKEVKDKYFLAFMNARKFNAFKADHYSLVVYGLCSTCARHRAKTSRTTRKS